jgi:hypothetical protein
MLPANTTQLELSSTPCRPTIRTSPNTLKSLALVALFIFYIQAQLCYMGVMRNGITTTAFVAECKRKAIAICRKRQCYQNEELPFEINHAGPMVLDLAGTPKLPYKSELHINKPTSVILWL